jgi:hypothetical protein
MHSWLDVRGFDSRQGLGIFLFNGPPIQWVPGALTLEVNRPGSEADHSPTYSAEVKECVELYVHSPICFHGVVLSLKNQRDMFNFTKTLWLLLLLLTTELTVTTVNGIYVHVGITVCKHLLNHFIRQQSSCKSTYWRRGWHNIQSKFCENKHISWFEYLSVETDKKSVETKMLKIPSNVFYSLRSLMEDEKVWDSVLKDSTYSMNETALMFLWTPSWFVTRAL